MVKTTFRRLLNPFAFPSETELRFILLIWAIVSLCWGVGFSFTIVLIKRAGWATLDELPSLEKDVLGVRVNAPDLPWLAAMAEHEKGLATKLAGLSDPEAIDRTTTALAQLSRTAHEQWVAAMLFLVMPVGLVLLTVLFITTAYVARARRPWFTHKGDSENSGLPEFRAAIDGLIEEAQTLQRNLGEPPLPRPELRISRGARGDGYIHGTARKPRIVLSRATPVLLKKEIRQHGKPVSIRTLVFHELAHLANRDVVRSGLTEVSWAVLVSVMIPLMAVWWLAWPSEGTADPRRHPMVVSLQVLGTLLVVELIRRGLLRSREHFADLRACLIWRASELPGVELQERSHPSTPPGLWKKHPTLKDRRDVLENPGLVFAIRKDAAFLAGLLFGSLFTGVFLLASVIMYATDGLTSEVTANLAQRYAEEKGLIYAMQFYYRTGQFVCSLAVLSSIFVLPVVTIYFLAGTLGVQAQRESVLQMAERHLHPHPYRALWKPAMLAAAGFEVGLLLVPLGFMMPASRGAALGVFLWLGYATLLFWLWLAAVRFFARRILGRHVAARSPGRRLRWMTMGSAILLLPLMAALIGAQGSLWSSTESPASVAVASGILGLLSFTIILTLMLFALAFWQTGRQGSRKPKCPSCQNDPGGTTVADRCSVCGKSLAPWLFLPERADPEGIRA